VTVAVDAELDDAAEEQSAVEEFFVGANRSGLHGRREVVVVAMVDSMP
jgi:hypothetical protein